MSTPSFQFKQFTVQQGQCAMKVNTDGVLLGAWQYKGEAKNILDIGTGTGVIAMMMAQGNPAAQVDAIDIDEAAWQQAKENFAGSPWSARLNAVHTSLQDFAPGKKYDVIISNPPYFVNDMQSDNPQKNIARHGVTLNYKELISGIDSLLANNGKALVVIPAANLSFFGATASKLGLFVNGVCEVTSVAGKPPHVVMLQLGRKMSRSFKTSMDIHTTDGAYTDNYKDITKEFYLAF